MMDVDGKEARYRSGKNLFTEESEVRGLTKESFSLRSKNSDKLFFNYDFIRAKKKTQTGKGKLLSGGVLSKMTFESHVTPEKVKQHMARGCSTVESVNYEPTKQQYQDTLVTMTGLRDYVKDRAAEKAKVKILEVYNKTIKGEKDEYLYQFKALCSIAKPNETVRCH